MNDSHSLVLPWWRRWRRGFYYRLLVLVLWVAGRISLVHGRKIGRVLAKTGARIRPEDSQRALSNLALAFPEVDSSRQMELFQRSIQMLGDNFHDTLATPALLKQPGFVVEEQGENALVLKLKELTQSGQGVFILTGHIGCWELLGGWMAGQVKHGGLGQLAAITGSIHNGPVDRLVQQRRQDLGLKALPRRGGLGPLLKHLQNGGIVAVLLDQNTRVDNLPVPFFGHDAPTPVGFAKMALRYGIPVLPVAINRRAEPNNGHKVIMGQEWVPEASNENNALQLKNFLVKCNQSLEYLIKRNPAEWVWFHERWSKRTKESAQR
ncbi:MAG: lysophospholipid acyltransferase family protein [bacterium]|nr:lysophospholipid acyltransferase family protein [bacterium]